MVDIWRESGRFYPWKSHERMRINLDYIVETAFEKSNGENVTRETGDLQGGIISPVHINLFMNYVFDK